MPFTYNKDIPLATDDVSISQGDLLNNFEQLSIAFNVNHVDFNLAYQGKHAFIHLPNQIAVPLTWPPITNGDELGLYASGGNLWLRPVNQAAGTVTNDVNFTAATKNAIGECTEPCGIIKKWGHALLVGGTDHLDIIFAVPFPTDIVSIQLSLRVVYDGAFSSRDYQISANQFYTVPGQAAPRFGIRVERDPGYKVAPVFFNWLAIGY